MSCNFNCSQGRRCSCGTHQSKVTAENEFASLYRYFRNKCGMGRWKAFRRALDCWSPI